MVASPENPGLRPSQLVVYLIGLVLRLHPGILYPTCIPCVFQEADPDEVKSARDLCLPMKEKGKGAGIGRKILQATVKV